MTEFKVPVSLESITPGDKIVLTKEQQQEILAQGLTIDQVFYDTLNGPQREMVATLSILKCLRVLDARAKQSRVTAIIDEIKQDMNVLGRQRKEFTFKLAGGIREGRKLPDAAFSHQVYWRLADLGYDVARLSDDEGFTGKNLYKLAQDGQYISSVYLVVKCEKR